MAEKRLDLIFNRGDDLYAKDLNTIVDAINSIETGGGSGVFLYMNTPREYHVLDTLTYYLSPFTDTIAWDNDDSERLASPTQNDTHTQPVEVLVYGFNPQFFVSTEADIETFKADASQYNLKVLVYGKHKKRNRYDILKAIPLVPPSEDADTADPGYFIHVKPSGQDPRIAHLSFVNNPINLLEVWGSYFDYGVGIREGIVGIYNGNIRGNYGRSGSLSSIRCKSPYRQLQEIALLNGEVFEPAMDTMKEMNTNAISYKMAFGIFKGEALCSNLIKGKVIFKWECSRNHFRLWFMEDSGNKVL